MDARDVVAWVDRYRTAWESNRPQDIEALFTDEARYWTAPYREPWDGRQAIVEGWIGRKDEPGDWTFTSEVLAVAGDLAFVRGETKYKAEGKGYSNLWVIRLDGDRASEFTEWWMQH